MIYKGQVIDIDVNYVVVLTEEMEYKRVLRKNSMCIGMSIMFVKEDIYVNHTVNMKALYKIAAVFILIFVTVGMFGRFNYIENVTASIVSIDINPSIELGVSQNGFVTELQSLNEEGSSILKEIQIGLEVSETVINILKNAYAAHYLDKEDSSILIAFAALNQNSYMKIVDQQEKIENTINSYAQFKSTTIEYIFTEKDSIKIAHENELSIGRFGLYENLKGENQSITVTSIKKMHIGELLRRRNGVNYKAVEIDAEIKEDLARPYRNGIKDESDATEILEPNDNGIIDGNSGDKGRVRKGLENQGRQEKVGNENQEIQNPVQSEEIIEKLDGQLEEVPEPEDKSQNPIDEGSGQKYQNGDEEHDQKRGLSESVGGDIKGEPRKDENNSNR
ncbi:MAG: anti-sigma factor protein [Anaerocolumna sp.]|jgi:hypothetical protein|nr:anti-sigma factor protein [Anaerocolumna sp.]